MSEFRIRSLHESDKPLLQILAKELDYSSVNDFMIDQIHAILTNGANNYYANKFVEEIENIKRQQNQILDMWNELQIKNIEMVWKLKDTQEIVTGWIELEEQFASQDYLDMLQAKWKELHPDESEF